ncbi:DUF348 domain-containing protein [Bacillus sp. RG28]|uniref:DUF348 domain-containing protein n=1 Tax=Gottfriedia endophytica TaxID=2820819 RepID=A0A940NY84_9BACI|nr:G5 and 3D domain-containing protein [Gottfriedia endophytica]MBP0727273.1 DUF348 domain-containing protein [Gottfriedia endophytica]
MIDANRLLSRLGSSKKLAVQLAGALVFTGSISTGAYEGLKDKVSLEVDGKQQVIQTHADTVGELLKEQKVNITNNDEVFPSRNTTIKNDMKISIHHFKPVKLSIDGNDKIVMTTAQTVKELLDEQNVNVQEHDKVTPELNAEIGQDGNVDINTSFPLTVNEGGKEQKIWSTSTTVADLLKNQQITLNQFDRVEPGLAETVKPNDTVHVIRVEKVNDVVEEALKFEDKTQNDSSMYKGNKKVLSNGSNGVVERNYQITKENGKIVSKQLIGEKTIKAPVNRIIAVGTKTPSRSMAAKEPSKGKEMYVEATAYSPYEGGMSGITATGINVRKNPNIKLIAVDPDIIPLGSKVWVEGYGVAIAGDTGGAINGHRIDVLFPTQQDCLKFGRKTIKIRVLK